MHGVLKLRTQRRRFPFLFLMPMVILDTGAVQWFICMREAPRSHKCHLNVPLAS